MKTPSAEQLEKAKQLIALELAVVPDGGQAEACARVHEKLTRQLAPLLGGAGLRALFSRSVTITWRDETLASSACTECATSSPRLRECLASLSPDTAEAFGVALFANFFELVTGFIGERLVKEALRSEWPSQTVRMETEK